MNVEESDLAALEEFDQAVDDVAVVMDVAVERGADTQHETDHIEPRLCEDPGACLAKMDLEYPLEDMENSADAPEFAHQEVA